MDLWNVSNNDTHDNTSVEIPYTEMLGYRIGTIIVKYAQIITVLIAVVGNGAALLTIAKIRPASTVTLSVGVLAVADTLGISVKLTYTKLTFSGVPLGDVGCQIFNFLVSYCVDYANWVVVLMTVERFVAVWYPLQVLRVLTMRRVRFSYCILAIILLPSSLCTFWMYQQIYYPGYGIICYYKPSMVAFAEMWDKVEFCIYVAIPCVSLIIINSLLIYALKASSASQRQALGSNAQKKDRKLMERQMTVMLVSASVVFILLMFPVGIFYLVRPNWNYQKTECSKATYYLIRSVVHFLADLSHAVNFFVYFLSGTKFRQTFISLFPCMCRGQRLGPRNQSLSLSGSTRATLTAN
ncbi:sex peptide receptor-related protein 2-like [Liolophura sinensis]|uniref:sex peptide receptor-related protein 2-like n=1 Tax=Liolophura sinensis TaxID=3198878 RepID=UPI0031587CAB